MTLPPRREAKPPLWSDLLVAAMLGVSLFLVEAGAAEIYRARNQPCEDLVTHLRFGAEIPPGCLGTESLAALTALSGGVIGAILVSAPQGLVWALAALVQALLGVFARLAGGRRWWVLAFLVSHAVLLGFATAFAYIGQYVG